MQRVKLLSAFISLALSFILAAPALADGNAPMLEGSFNTRDMGGYATKSGAQVKSGKLFRSDDLYTITDADLTLLQDLPLRTIFDFRRADEKQRKPDRIPASVCTVHLYETEPGTFSGKDLAAISREDMYGYMAQYNRDLVNNNQDSYRKFFAVLAEEDCTPILFHCSSGKDRAGLGAALLLSALGVEREIIFEDYMRSKANVLEKHRQNLQRRPNMEAQFTVERSYLEAAFAEIDRKYGGVDKYLVNQLGADLEKLRSLYTE